MTEMIYEYDGSFEGFLTCIFESYAQKEVLTAISCGEDIPFMLFPVRTVLTDRDHAARVYRKVVKLSPEAAGPAAPRLSHLPAGPGNAPVPSGGEAAGGGAPVPPGPVDETLYPILRAVRHLNGEVHQVQGLRPLLRPGGRTGGEIEPKNRVLPLLRRHFCDRYRNERFFLYDRTHQEALFYAEGRSAVRPLEHFQMAPPDEAEARYRLLWKRFYDTIAIRERENPRCRMTHMPKRYWGTMTEFQGEAHFRARGTPATVSGPGAPAGIPAPETPPGSGQSVPGSVPWK